MNRINQALAKSLPVLLLSTLILSCASIPELQILYRLPPRSGELQGGKIALTIEDRRALKTILGKGARPEFEGFTETISLSVARDSQKGLNAGIFKVPSLLREAFKRRLENAGLEVRSEKSPGIPQLAVIINEFRLDLIDREWIARMNYEAKLIKDGKIVANRIINGQAEQYKLIGRDAADTLMGEIFTDMINALDLISLFKQAGIPGIRGSGNLI